MSAGGAEKRVLLVKFGAIGDVVMAVPAAKALCDRGYAIDWACGAAVAPLLRCYPWIRTIVVDDKAILKGSIVARTLALTNLWRELAGVRYELCATLYYDARYRLVTLPVMARRRLNLSDNNRASRLIAGRHHTDEYARILLGEEDSCRERSLGPIRPEDLPASPLAPRRGPVRVGLVPGGASNMLRQQTLRRWPVTRYVEIAKILTERGYEVALLGGADDVWVRPEFSGLNVLDAIGGLSLPEVVSACDSCDVVISHDTGPLHLAGLSTAALIGLFGPTDPGNFLPRRAFVRCLWGGEELACRPCYDGRDFAPCRDNGCMRDIETEKVLATVGELLSERTTMQKSEARNADSGQKAGEQ